MWYKSLNQFIKYIFWGIFIYAIFFGVGGSLLYNLTNILNDNDEDKNMIVQQCVDNNDIEGAKAAIRDGGKPTPLYEYYLNKHMWDEAEEYIPHYYSTVSNEEYFSYCKKAVTIMCKEGKMKEAKKFIKRKIAFYEKYNAPTEDGHNEWNTKIVQKRLNAIVDNY